MNWLPMVVGHYKFHTPLSSSSCPLIFLFFLTKTRYNVRLSRIAQWNRSIRFGSLRGDLADQRQQRHCRPHL
jgi:hypothetical protein